jgi:geranylgeranyl diphosphate synthase, type II
MAFSSRAFSQLEKKYLTYRDTVNKKLGTLFGSAAPRSLYEPADYILKGKGKRIRPMLVLFGAEAISGRSAAALPIALAVEVLHNFTLIHDDIMDNADLRHGRATVHVLWNDATAILTGDVMHAVAYDLILQSKSKQVLTILKRFNQSVIEICDGQAYDMEFENRRDVSLRDYLMMISKKTGRLIATSLELGGLSAGATPAQAKALRTYGELLGEAFQVQDDLLDIMAGEKSGKKVGGDVIEGKKTFLLLKALEMTKGSDRKLLESVMNNDLITDGDVFQRVEKVKAVYERCGVLQEAEKLIRHNFQKAKKLTATFPNANGRATLLEFTEMVMAREF